MDILGFLAVISAIISKHLWLKLVILGLLFRKTGPLSQSYCSRSEHLSATPEILPPTEPEPQPLPPERAKLLPTTAPPTPQVTDNRQTFRTLPATPPAATQLPYDAGKVEAITVHRPPSRSPSLGSRGKQLIAALTTLTFSSRVVSCQLEPSDSTCVLSSSSSFIKAMLALYLSCILKCKLQHVYCIHVGISKLEWQLHWPL